MKRLLGLTMSMLRHANAASRLNIAAFIFLACVSACLDLVLLMGLVGFARLLIQERPFAGGPDWLSLPLAQRSAPEMTVLAGALLLFVISVLKTLIQVWSATVRHGFLAPLLQVSIRSLFAQQLVLSYRDALRRNASQTIAIILDDLRVSVQNVLMPALEMVTDAIFILAILIFLLVIDPVMTLVLMVTFSCGAIAQQAFMRALVSRDRTRAREIVPRLLDIITQALSSFKEIKVMRRELGFRRRIRPVARAYARQSSHEGLMGSLPRYWNENFLFLCLVMLTVVQIATRRPMEQVIPFLALFSASGWRLLPLFNRVLRAAALIRFNIDRAQTVLERWDAAAVCLKPAIATTDAVFTDAIRLRGLSCGHAGAPPAVTGLDAEIRRGEAVVVVGPSGSGKTTLIDTLLGLLPPVAGQILVDGRPLDDLVRDRPRLIGYVPQDPYIANETVLYNLLWGLPAGRVPEARVQAALAQVGLTDIIAALPDGVRTRLGERGARLSGGQRQRLCIARALLADPAILVLDEATSQLDLSAETALLASLRASSPDLTLILVTHRPQTATIGTSIIDLMPMPRCA